MVPSPNSGADIKADKESGHGQQSVVPLAALAPQPPPRRAGLSPPDLPREENDARAQPFESPPEPRIRGIT